MLDERQPSPLPSHEWPLAELRERAAKHPAAELSIQVIDHGGKRDQFSGVEITGAWLLRNLLRANFSGDDLPEYRIERVVARL